MGKIENGEGRGGEGDERKWKEERRDKKVGGEWGPAANGLVYFPT